MTRSPVFQEIVRRWISLDASWRFAITAFLVARAFYGVWSWILLTIQPVVVHYAEIDGKTAIVFLDLRTTKSFSFFREIGGQGLDFRPAGRTTATDLQTNSVWEIHTGRAVAGPLTGVSLAHAPADPSVFPYFNTTPFPNAWLALWQRYDTIWYISIAESGYGSLDGDIHFPPLFPLLIRLATALTGNSFIAGLVIAHLATLGTLKLLYDLFIEWGAAPTARGALTFFLIYPASFFLFSAYSESLFIMVVLIALRAMKSSSWGWAGFWIFCAILTRLQGVGLFAPLLYLMWKDAPFLRKIHHWVGLTFAGAGFLFYLFLRSAQMTAVSIPFSEPIWHAQLAPPWETYLYAVRTILANHYTYIDFLNWTVTTLFICLVIIGWKKIPLEHNIYAVSSLFILLSRIVDTQPLSGMLRFSLTLYPVFFTLGLIAANPWIRRIILYVSVALNLYLSADFFGWGWVA